MADPFELYEPGMDAPFSRAAAVTPNDSTDLPTSSRSLWIGLAGNLSVITVGGDQVDFPNVTVGWFPGRIRRVRSTGTTAADIVAVW